MSSVDEIVDRTIIRLSQVTGAGVQTYAEPQILEAVQHKFDALFDEVFWPHLSGWTTVTLDETTGKPTTDLITLIKSFKDIQAIFPGTSDRQLPILSGHVNAARLDSGTEPKYVQALPEPPVWYNVASALTTAMSSTTVTVNLGNREHGLAVSDKVRISGVQAAIDGIPVGNLNAVHAVVSVVDAFSFTVTVATSATAGLTSTETVTVEVVDHLFRILPPTSEGDITIRYRTKPNNFILDEGMDCPFDDQAMILGAAWDFLEDQGNNPGAAEKMRIMFEARVAQLKKAFDTLPHDMGRGGAPVLDVWAEL